jgi:hypothetical protein
MSPNASASALGALVLAAIAFGVHLGQSTIDQINPIHFQGPAVHPRDRGAVAYDTIETAQQPQFSRLYGWEEGGDARSLDCNGCEAVGARDAFAGGGELRYAVMETGWSGPRAEPASYEAEPEAEPLIDDAPADYAEEPSQLDRYSSFAIEEKDEPAELALLQE